MFRINTEAILEERRQMMAESQRSMADDLASMPEFADLVARLTLFEPNEIDTKQRKEQYTERFITSIRDIYFWTAEVPRNNRTFVDFVDILRWGFEIFTTKGAYTAHMREGDSLFDVVGKFFDIDPERYGNQFMRYCLRLAKNSLRIPLSAPYTYKGYVTRVILEGPSALTGIAEVLDKTDLRNVLRLMRNSGEVYMDDFFEGLRELPQVATAAKAKGYQPEFSSALHMLARVRGVDIEAPRIFAGLVETCEELTRMGCGHVYRGVIDALKETKKRRFPVTSKTYLVLAPGNLLPTVERYQRAGLEDKMLDTLKTCRAMVGIEHDCRQEQDKQELPAPMEFFQEYPRLREMLGERVYDIFTKFQETLKNDIPIEAFEQLVEQFVDGGYEKRTSFEEWFDYLAKADAMTNGVRDIALAVSSLDAIQNDVNLESWLSCIKPLSTYYLFCESKKLKGLIESDTDEATKQRFIEYYAILKGIHNLPAVRPDDSWLGEVADLIGMPQKKMVGWLNKVAKARLAYLDFDFLPKGAGADMADGPNLHERMEAAAMKFSERLERIQESRLLGESYVQAIPLLVEANVDLREYYMLLPSMPQKIVAEIPTALGYVVNAKATRKRKKQFLDGLKDNEELVSYHEPSHLDINRYLQEARAIHDEQQALFSSALAAVEGADEAKEYLEERLIRCDIRRDLAALARITSSKERVKRIFSQGKEYGSTKVYALSERLDPVEATRILVQGLISEVPERIREASEYLQTEHLEAARKLIANSNTPPRTLYRQLAPLLNELDIGVHPQREIAIGEMILEKIQYVYLTSTSDVLGKEQMRELVWLVESLYGESEIFDELHAKMQDVSLEDIMGGRRLLCCSMVSPDREKEEIEALYYCLDPYIAMLHFTPSLNGEYAKPIGAAILANARYNNNELLLVDSVEGGTLFNQISEEKSMPFAVQAIVDAADDCDDEYIFFNEKVGGDTPKRFIRYVAKLLGAETQDIELSVYRPEQAVTSKRSRYLETFKNRELLSGEATGYLVRTEALRSLL